MITLDFRFITPPTVDDLAQYADDIDFIGTFWPWPDFYQVALQWVPAVTLVYDAHSDRILGVMSVLLHKRSAELHAVFRQDLKYAFPHGRLIMRAITRQVLHDAFITHAKEKVFIKVRRESKGGHGFALINGFTKINREADMTVWRLTRREYQERQHDTLSPATA